MILKKLLSAAFSSWVISGTTEPIIISSKVKFYFEKVLPRAEQHYKSAISGSSNIMNFKFS